MNVAHQLPVSKTVHQPPLIRPNLQEATQLSRSVLETCRRGSGTSDQLRNLPQRRPSTHSEGKKTIAGMTSSETGSFRRDSIRVKKIDAFIESRDKKVDRASFESISFYLE